MQEQEYPMIEVSVTDKHAFFSSGTVGCMVFEKDHLFEMDIPDKQLKEECAAALSAAGFSGKKDQLHVFAKQSKKVIFLGMGKREAFSVHGARMAAAKLVKAADGISSKELSISAKFASFADSDIIIAMAEAAIMAPYQFNQYKSERPKFQVQKVFLSTSVDVKEAQKALNVGLVFGRQNLKARHLLNTPAAVATPQFMAEVAWKIGKEMKLGKDMLKKNDLRRKGMNGILQVCAGSVHEPVMVVLEYGKQFKKSRTYALVGKGVCFDSGGLDIKNASGMETMKMDKGGAVAAMVALEAIAKLKLPVHVFAVVPFVENMIAGNSYKPGDIITSSSGKTIEVLNTDAEGRIILADAIDYAATALKADAIIDLATLTGAVITALGNNVAGMMGNNEELIRKLFEAGEKTYERVWQLPTYREYDDLIQSDHADVKNVVSNSGGAAGTITAAKFLEHFVREKAWVHLDIAGTAWNDKPDALFSKGGTGAGVRLLAQFFIDESASNQPQR